MRKGIKIIIFMVLLIFFIPCKKSLAADGLPWLNFGNIFEWNESTQTLSDGDSLFVQSVTYLDTTTIPPPFSPMDPNFDPIIWSSVSLSISFNGIDDDYISIQNASTLFFSANLDIIYPQPDSTGPIPYTVMIKSDGLYLNTASGSEWVRQFSSQIDPSLQYVGYLNIAWFPNFIINTGPDTYKINGVGLITVVPEPMSSVLFGVGGVILILRKKIIKIFSRV